MWFAIYIIFMNLFIGFWLAIELKRRYRELYLDHPVEGKNVDRKDQP